MAHQPSRQAAPVDIVIPAPAGKPSIGGESLPNIGLCSGAECQPGGIAVESGGGPFAGE